MNILLVDDEKITLEMLKHEINWKELNFNQIFTACSVAEAREIFRKEQVQILLCDIEMPMESGFDLWNWVKQEQLMVQCVFLTCHADFSYAREALAMGVVDYVLKPVNSADITSALRKAAGKYREASLAVTRQQVWNRNQVHLYRQFWMDFLSGSILPEKEEIQQELENRSLPLSFDHAYMPILLVPVSRQTEDPAQLRRHNREYTQLLDRICSCRPYPYFLIPQNDGTIICILEINSGPSLSLKNKEPDESKHVTDIQKKEFPWEDKEAFTFPDIREEAGQICEDFLNHTAVHEDSQHLSVCFYLGLPAALIHMPQMLERLQSMAYQNVLLDTPCLSMDYRNKTEFQESRIPFPAKKWGDLLDNMDFSGVLSDIEHFLNQPSVRNKLTSESLDYLVFSYYQLLVSFALRHQLILTDIIDPSESSLYTKNAHRSLAGFLVWISYTTEALKKYFHHSLLEMTPEQKVRNYVAENICRNISVVDIADHLHMNSSYLSRIFKKSTGNSLYSYVQEQKILEAKKRMISTSAPIGEIALDLGFQSYVSFSRVFTKLTGMSPKEYKQRCMKGEIHV